jgi:glycosyltransferase involved in cell wall biosynthesis
VISEHFTGFQRGLIRGYVRFVARLAFRYADLVAPVSEELAVRVRMMQPRARMRVIGNVVDTDVFHAALGVRKEAQDVADREGATRDGSARLLTVAALAEKKGLTDLLEAIAQLRRTHAVTLDLVGEGDQRAALEERVRSLGLDQVVRLRGALGKREVAELMRQADLFVLPSLFENLPCVLLEAMASGLPFVATRVGGVPVLLRGEYGILTEPGDPAALAASIAGALDRPERFDRQGAVNDARARFGYEAFARTWTAVYRALRGGAPPPLGELAGEGADESRVVA